MAASSWRDLAKVTDEGHFEEEGTAFFAFDTANGAWRPSVMPVFKIGAVPQLGKYSNDSFDPFLPIVCLGLGLKPALAALPVPIQAMLKRAAKMGFIQHPEDVEVYATVSSGIAEKECGLFNCPSTRHINLQLHGWAFSLASETMEILQGGAMNASIYCGLYEGQGVEPVHRQECMWYGLAGTGLQNLCFGDVEKLQVLAHDGRFSPNNGNFGIREGVRDATFFTLAIDRQRDPASGHKACVTLHAALMGDERADEVRKAVRGKATLGELMPALEGELPEFHRRLHRMLEGLPWEAAGAAAAAGGAPAAREVSVDEAAAAAAVAARAAAAAAAAAVKTEGKLPEGQEGGSGSASGGGSSSAAAVAAGGGDGGGCGCGLDHGEAH